MTLPTGVGFPPDVPGDSDAEKKRNYARAMAHAVEDAYPTAFITNRLKNEDGEGKKANFLAKEKE